MEKITMTVLKIHIKHLKEMLKKKGLKVSDLIRRAVDLFYEEFKKKG